MRVILFAFLIMLQVASVGHAEQHEDGPVAVTNKGLNSAGAVISIGTQIYWTGHDGLSTDTEQPKITYWVYKKKIHICQSEMNYVQFGERGFLTPSITCYPQADLAKYYFFDDEWDAFKRFDEIAFTLFYKYKKPLFSKIEWMDKTYTTHIADGLVWICSTDIFDFLLCANQMDFNAFDILE